jgi:hypothetical protein
MKILKQKYELCNECVQNCDSVIFVFVAENSVPQPVYRHKVSGVQRIFMRVCSLHSGIIVSKKAMYYVL